MYESLPIKTAMEMSPEINNKRKGSQDRYQDDDLSKFSDEKRSTLPLHSDSFKKHSPGEDKNGSYHKEPNLEIIDTEKRNQNKEFRVNSPHFLEEMKFSGSNPFMPWSSNAKSLEYGSTPQKDSKPDPFESLRLIIGDHIQKYGPKQMSSFLSECLGTEISYNSSDNRPSFNLKQLQSEKENLEERISTIQDNNTKLKEKCEFYNERANTLDKLLRERESKLLHFSTELENATLMETQLKKEVEVYKTQREEIEKEYKNLKLTKGKEAIQLRQLKSDIESKKREIIDASDLIDRATTELEEVKRENNSLNQTVEKLEKEKFDHNLKYKKLERELYKMSCEKKKLNSVIQMQKDSLNELQKDYYNSQEYNHGYQDKRTFEHVPSDANLTYNGDSTVVFNPGSQNTFFHKNSTQENILHSFDNLNQFESRTFHDQTSPFSSTRTLNKIQKTAKNSFTDSVDRELLTKHQLKQNSESQKTFNENHVNISETEFYYPDEELETGIPSSNL